MPTLILAPMEGLLDHGLRRILTRVGGVDRCVSEFIRITDQLLPLRSFTRIVPELLHNSRTTSGVPVTPQLLGSDPACLADNAARLSTLNPAGIDLNFGCPAKTVNRHRGGAVLLDEPELIHAIVAAVRRAVPAHIPVSAKMRLGNRDNARMLDVARAIEAAGASELTVHARTKAQGYKPPAHWAEVGRVRDAVRLPVIANGDIFTPDDAARCRAESGCQNLMLGRGIIRRPALALALRHTTAMPGDMFDSHNPQHLLPWPRLLPLLRDLWDDVCQRVEPRHRAGRLKQWLSNLRLAYPEAQQAFDALRLLQSPTDIDAWLQTQQKR